MIVAVGIVKDEADIIAYTLMHLFEQGVDKIVVADNGSTDGTRDLLCGPVIVEDDPDPAWYQSRKMTDLASRHCREGDWVIPFDADERWTGLTGTLATSLRATKADVLTAQVYDYLPHLDDPASEPNPYRRIRWREPHPETYPVVAFRYQPGIVIEEGNHGVRHPGRVEAGLSVRHYQYRTFSQFCRKLRNGRQALEATNLPGYIGAHWRTWGALDDDGLRAQWDGLLGQPLVYDPL